MKIMITIQEQLSHLTVPLLCSSSYLLKFTQHLQDPTALIIPQLHIFSRSSEPRALTTYDSTGLDAESDHDVWMASGTGPAVTDR